MISPNVFLELLKKSGVDFFAGVPDSLLKDICLCIEETVPSGRHIIAANEGAAVGLASGHYLATGKIPMIYMQNSGLGNAVNPLTSLADQEVYSIPMLVMIGWRGEPGTSDEPQHKKMGKVTLDVLNSIHVPHVILSDDPTQTEDDIARALKMVTELMAPVAVIVKKDTFSKYAPTKEEDPPCVLPLSREQALEIIIKNIGPKDITVSTTGKLSRELFELRVKHGQPHERDFLTVGSMGHASQIALGIALESDRKVICLDGDGAIIMHMGSLAINGAYAPFNFIHVVLNNGCHESVGGQPTMGFNIDLPKIALACGYKQAEVVESEAALVEAVTKALKADGPSMIEVRISKDSRKDLGRPTKTPLENKAAFMDFLKSE